MCFVVEPALHSKGFSLLHVGHARLCFELLCQFMGMKHDKGMLNTDLGNTYDGLARNQTTDDSPKAKLCPNPVCSPWLMMWRL